MHRFMVKVNLLSEGRVKAYVSSSDLSPESTDQNNRVLLTLTPQ